MTKKLVAFVILCSLIIGGIGGWVFTRYVIPKINSIPFLTKYHLTPSAGPVVINTREEVHVDEGTDTVAVIQKAQPWVVGILNNASDPGALNFKGTGVILTSDGLIATTTTVSGATAASGAATNSVRVVLPDGSVHQASVVATDSATALSLLKISNVSGLATAQFGSVKDLQLGQKIIALSESFANNSEEDNTSYVNALAAPDFSAVNFSDTISETFGAADLNGSADGALLISLDGDIEGIYVAATSGASAAPSKIISSNVIKDALNNYFANQSIVRPVFGFYYQQISKAAANALGLQTGLLIKRPAPNRAAIVAGSPAQAAQLHEGDLITAVNGTNVNDENSFYDLTENVKPGGDLTLKVTRGANQLTLTLTPAKH